MIDDADLETSVLEFVRKSFSFDRSVDWDGVRLSVFHRTETESERKFRPRIVRLTVVVPTAWLAREDESIVRVAPEGRIAPRPAGGEAVETAAEASRFDEDGVAWRRWPAGSGGFLYAPEAWADRLSGAGADRRLGLP